MISDVADIHLAVHDTGSAVGAAVRIDLHTDDRKLVEHAVDRAQRAYESAE